VNNTPESNQENPNFLHGEVYTVVDCSQEDKAIEIAKQAIVITDEEASLRGLARVSVMIKRGLRIEPSPRSIYRQLDKVATQVVDLTYQGVSDELDSGLLMPFSGDARSIQMALNILDRQYVLSDSTVSSDSE
jgi:hypothetical protein